MTFTSEQQQSLMDHLESVRQQQLNELAAFIRIPSVSKDPDRSADMMAAAEFVADAGRRAGADAEILQTSGHPATILEWRAGPDDPTVLIYAHMDVMPAEPEGFEPTVRDGRIFGRGATDMKGPLLANINAISGLRTVISDLRLNITMLIEGEEETSSTSLREVLSRGRARFAADVALISDSMMLSLDRPAICVGLRGWIGLELTVSVAPRPVASSGLHSGDLGGVAPNALHVLAAMLASLHDDTGRVAVDGFYDRVGSISSADAEVLAALPDNENELRELLGARRLVGEPGFSPRERTSCRPTLELHGMLGGYPGPGIKNAVPREARANLSCRLVGDQKPDHVAALVERHLRDALPDYADLEVTHQLGTPPIRLPLTDPHLALVAEALTDVFGCEPALMLAGGSGTAPALFRDELGLAPILVGFSSPGENPHSADENFHLASFERGAAAIALFLARLATP